MGKNNLRTLHMNANEHDGYWQLRITIDQYDDEGMPHEVLTLRAPTKAPLADMPIDQAWLLLVLAIHLLEREGAMGRIAGADWPALPI